jgi:hypothetical protein
VPAASDHTKFGTQCDGGCVVELTTHGEVPLPAVQDGESS